MQTQNLREEIINIRNDVVLEHSEKISAFNRVGELMTELKKESGFPCKTSEETHK